MSGIVVGLAVGAVAGLAMNAVLWLLDEWEWDRAQDRVRLEHPELFRSER